MRNSENINLFELDLKLYERNVSDQIALENFINLHKDNNSNLVQMQVVGTIVIDSLKYNLSTYKWYELKEKYILKKKLKLRYIFKHLTINELIDIQVKILTLEGQEVKKKVHPGKKSPKK